MDSTEDAPPVFVDDVNHDDPSEINLKASTKVKNIHIDGLSRTQNKLVTNQLERLFDCNTFESVLKEAHLGKLKLERLGVFAGIEVFIDVTRDNSANDSLDVYYFVKESRRLSANVGTNVGNNEGNMTVGGRINNLRGLGETIKADVSLGTRVSSSYEFAVAKPMFYDPDKKLTIRALKAMNDFQQSCYKETARGVACDITIPSPIGMHILGWEGMWRENVPAQSVPFAVREHAGHTLKSSVKHSLISDSRDDWILPSKGNLFKHNLEFAGLGGNIRAVKSDVEINVNKEIFQDFVIAASLQAGIARPLDGKSLMINDRYFLGGPLSVRGFGMKGIGQHAEQASLGGELFWAGGLHLFTPLPFRPGAGGFGEYFRLHIFANAGNLGNLNTDKKEFLMSPRYSFGAGVMLMLGGMARLEVNYCVPKNAQPGDVINPGLQVGVGLSFL